MRGDTKTRLVSLGVLLVVLSAGFALGVAWERSGSELPVVEAAERDAREDNEGGEGAVREGERKERSKERRLIVDRVGLEAGQEARIDSIVQAHRKRMKALQKEFRAEYNPRYWALVEETRDAIREELTPAQRRTYDSLLVEWDRRRDEKDRERGVPNRR